jgi:hypothetical protein
MLKVATIVICAHFDPTDCAVFHDLHRAHRARV